MARYSEIWQDMAMQYCKATALISRMEASHEITKLTDRALAVLEPRFHICLRILLQNCTFFLSQIISFTFQAYLHEPKNGRSIQCEVHELVGDEDPKYNEDIKADREDAKEKLTQRPRTWQR